MLIKLLQISKRYNIKIKGKRVFFLFIIKTYKLISYLYDGLYVTYIFIYICI